MDAASYDQYLRETDDWLKVARAQLLADLIEQHAARKNGLALLEVGAGGGQNLASLARFGVVDAIEINDLGRKAIRTRKVARDVFADPIPFDLDRRYDVICAMDVIEHLVDDGQAVRWMAAHLHPGGLLIMTVPAYQWLFSDHDRALGHHRRYTRTRLIATLPNELETVTAAYFTHLAFPLAVAARGAFSLRQILRGAAPAKQASPRGGTLERALAALQGFELALMRRGYRPPFGLSTFVVARAATLGAA